VLRAKWIPMLVSFASGTLLGDVMRRIGAAGWAPISLDLTIVAARPRLATHLDAMRASIPGALSVNSGQVNVKASTGNLDGMEGAGRGISALAIAVVGPVR